jgi:hypothetical protein
MGEAGDQIRRRLGPRAYFSLGNSWISGMLLASSETGILFRGGAGATFPRRGKCEIQHRPSPRLRCTHKRSRTESAGSKHVDTPRERRVTSEVDAECLPDKHRPSSRTPLLSQPFASRTTRKLQLHRVQLLARRSAQRPSGRRTLCLTCSQESPEAGLLARFAFLRANSCFCQSWTGTASGVRARSSQRSSTSWSFSAGLRSKIDGAAGFMSVSTVNCLRIQELSWR